MAASTIEAGRSPSNERRVTGEPGARSWVRRSMIIDAGARNDYIRRLRAGADRPALIWTALPMLVTLMKAKLHRATVTQADLDYGG